MKDVLKQIHPSDFFFSIPLNFSKERLQILSVLEVIVFWIICMCAYYAQPMIQKYLGIGNLCLSLLYSSGGLDSL